MPEQRGVPDGLPVGKLALVALLVFLPGVTGGFVFDDIPLIRDNPYVHSPSYLGRAFSSSFWEIAGTARYYRPVVTVSYLVDWLLGGGQAWPFHLTNAGLHALATGLAAVVALRWTGNRPTAIAAALLFALHPSRTQSVTWISGRPDLLMTVLLLAAVELSHRAAHGSTGRSRARLFGLSLGAFGLSVLSKESGVIMPLLVGVDLALTSGAPRQRLGRYVAVTGGIALGYVAVRSLLYPTHPGIPIEVTPLRGLLTVFAYVERIVFPWPQTFFNRPLAVEGGTPLHPLHLVLAGALVVAAFAVLLARAWRRDRAAAWLLLGFVVSLGPFLNFTRTGLPYTTADHLLYLPLLLLFSGTGRLLAPRMGAWSERRDVKLALTAVLLTWSGIVLVRTLDYRDQEALFESELALMPDNPLALMSLGEEAARAGDVERAFALSLNALAKKSQRYPSLLPESLAARTYQRLLGLQAARTADGSSRDLRLLLAEMERLLQGRSGGAPEPVGELELGRVFESRALRVSLESGGREALTAEAALVASRVGRRDVARRLLGALGPDDLRHVPSVGNLILAHARVEDFTGAGHLLPYLPNGQDAESRRLRAVQGLLARGRAVPFVEASVLRAQAYLELGAYLLALRELRPAYDRAPTHPVVGPLYVHLLMAARLEHEAEDAATHALGAEGARSLLEGIRREMPPRLLGLRRPVEPATWLDSSSAP